MQDVFSPFGTFNNARQALLGNDSNISTVLQFKHFLRFQYSFFQPAL